MNDIIVVKPEKCVGCNACIRSCPAPEANISKMLENGRFITTVNSDKCIACGQCIRACNHGARDYIDDTRVCMQRLEKDKTIILVHPAIRAVFPNHWINILNWFRKKGCMIYDVSFGADICTWVHLRSLENQKTGKIITQQCPAIVKYIQTYQPNILKNLSPVHSPVACAVAYIKKYLRRTNPIAVLTPCIASKNEYAETGLVEYNVTFKKLKEYFDSNGIVIHTNSEQDLEYKFDDQQGQLGAIYSRPGGIRDNLLLHDPEINICTSEGVNKVYSELDTYANVSDIKRPDVFDTLSCEFGCNLGPAADTKSTSFDVMRIMRDVENDAKKRRKTNVFKPSEDKLFKRFDDELNIDDFLRTYKSGNTSPVLSEKQLDVIYKLMGKNTDAEKCYDCRACGYNSCRDMATAICRGINTPNNCVVHAKSELTAQHKQLVSNQEKFLENKEICLTLSKELKSKMDNIKTNLAAISESTNKTSERSRVVNDLLTNIITFCQNNDSLNSEGINQMIVILETTLKAFNALDENVNTTNKSSGLITQSVAEIKDLIESINKTLSETAAINKSEE
ncbi:MAG: 4Fe-4S binding protein [Ruminococcus sp.]|nr:4Fe-4S binding protein [Ruminococcus sp.]